MLGKRSLSLMHINSLFSCFESSPPFFFLALSSVTIAWSGQRKGLTRLNCVGGKKERIFLVFVCILLKHAIQGEFDSKVLFVTCLHQNAHSIWGLEKDHIQSTFELWELAATHCVFLLTCIDKVDRKHLLSWPLFKVQRQFPAGNKILPTLKKK